jgi:hypothetical protein
MKCPGCGAPDDQGCRRDCSEIQRFAPRLVESAPSMTLEDYFKHELADGKIDFSLRASVFDGVVEFYIHPSGRNGTTTPSLIVNGNTVRLKPGSWSPDWKQGTA